MDRVDQMIAALTQAYAHVVRQVHAGKHAQDRVDAEDWLRQWGPVVKWAREQPTQKPLPTRAPFEVPIPTGRVP